MVPPAVLVCSLGGRGTLVIVVLRQDFMVNTKFKTKQSRKIMRPYTKFGFRLQRGIRRQRDSDESDGSDDLSEQFLQLHIEQGEKVNKQGDPVVAICA